MSKLERIKNIVARVLEEHEDARKNDFVLLSYVLDEMGVPSNFDMRTMLRNHKIFGLPPFESVSRARRKAQAENKSLKDAPTAAARQEKQKEYEEFARL